MRAKYDFCHVLNLRESLPSRLSLVLCRCILSEIKYYWAIFIERKYKVDPIVLVAN